MTEARVSDPFDNVRLIKCDGVEANSSSYRSSYVVVDETPAAAKIEDAGYLHSCNGCEAKIARDLGAELAITGTVQKVSNLILNINLYVRDAATKKQLRAMSADIRGNTDRSWSRGVTYLVKNRLLKE